MTHRLDEDLGVCVVIGVAVGYDDAVELLGIKAGPVGIDEGTRPRIDVDVGLIANESETRSPAFLGDHGKAAAAGP
jgi:hypothetical protein